VVALLLLSVLNLVNFFINGNMTGLVVGIIGLAVTVLGFPVYFWLKKKK
jgi:hypothetical protein